MRSPRSSYYPPRAGFLRPLRELGFELRRWLHLTYGGPLFPSLPRTEWRDVWCLLVPGVSFMEAGWPRVGKLMLALWLAAFVVFLMWLGYAPANVAFAAMLSIHVSSVMHLINRTSPGMGLLRRLAFSLVVLFLVGQCLYGVVLRWAVLPLKHQGRVYIVHRMTPWSSLKRGDMVAYHTRGTFGTVRIRQGYVLGPILAGPGDVVTFTQGRLLVNDMERPRQKWMPREGTWKIPQNTWLIWPELSTVAYVNVPEEQITDAVRSVAMVRRDDITGKPFGRWFWRKQST